MTEAARLVDELTTLLYEVVKRWQLPDGRVCEIVACGACRRKADRAESVVHESDCPVYRLIRAEEANTAVIRANAEEIADLEDRRDDLEAKFNAVVAEIERERKLFADLTDASVRRIDRLTASNAVLAEQVRTLREALLENVESTSADGHPCWCGYDTVYSQHADWCKAARAALAGSREQAQGEGAPPVTTRTITMRCHCGRGVTIGPEPWCAGCVQSAATCDCVSVTGEG